MDVVNAGKVVVACLLADRPNPAEEGRWFPLEAFEVDVDRPLGFGNSKGFRLGRHGGSTI